MSKTGENKTKFVIYVKFNILSCLSISKYMKLVKMAKILLYLTYIQIQRHEILVYVNKTLWCDGILSNRSLFSKHNNYFV